MKITSTRLMLLFFSILSINTHADDLDDYVFTSLLFVHPDDSRGSLEDSYGVSGGYGWRWGERWHPEFNLHAAVLDTGNNGGTDFYQIGTGLDLRFDITKTAWRPFLIGGIGAVYDDVIPDSEDSYEFYANAGLGLLSPPFTDFGIRFRADARLFWDAFNSGQTDTRFGIGIVIPIGKTEVREREVIKEVEKIVYVPTPVEGNDRDKDGVMDNLDQCPNTLINTEVNDVGCISGAQTVRLSGITFAYNSASLKPESESNLDKIASSLIGQPDLSVEIAGHTDNTGANDYNLYLSQARANSVRAYLMSAGVNSNQMTARGYGENEPIDTNATEQGRAANRRVEFRVK